MRTWMPRTSTFLYSGARKSSSLSSSSSAVAGKCLLGRRGQAECSPTSPSNPSASVPALGPTSGEDTGVHEGGHAEVGQDKEEDDAIVDRDDWGHRSGQPWTPVEQQGRAGGGTGADGPWEQGQVQKQACITCNVLVGPPSSPSVFWCGNKRSLLPQAS